MFFSLACFTRKRKFIPSACLSCIKQNRRWKPRSHLNFSSNMVIYERISVSLCVSVCVCDISCALVSWLRFYTFPSLLHLTVHKTAHTNTHTHTYTINPRMDAHVLVNGQPAAIGKDVKSVCNVHVDGGNRSGKWENSFTAFFLLFFVLLRACLFYPFFIFVYEKFLISFTSLCLRIVSCVV